MNIKFGQAVPYDIKIQASKNNGYIVTVGCGTFVFENNESLIEALRQYLDDPKKAEEEYNKAWPATTSSITFSTGPGVYCAP